MFKHDSGELAVHALALGDVPAADSGTPVAAVLAAAREHATAGRAALLDTANGGELDRGELTFGRFAAVVPAAAAGLIRRGVRAGDVGAVHLDGAANLALAVHAVAAAGAVPAVLPPPAGPDALAELMIGCAARFLLTSADLAEAALAAADRSYVRQVIVFGDVPGATPFAELLTGGETGTEPVEDALAGLDPLHDLALRTPAERFTHADRLADLYRLSGIVPLTEADVLVAHPPDCPVPTWLGLIDLALLHGASVVAVRDPAAGALRAAVRRARGTVVVATPAKLRALAAADAEGAAGGETDGGGGAVPAGLRVLTTGRPPPEAARAARLRRWSLTPLG